MSKGKVLSVVLWVRDFIRKHFNSDNENLPYYITIAISAILFVIAMNGFIELTDNLVENELGDEDELVTEKIIAMRSEALTTYSTYVTHLGSRGAYIILTVMLALFFFLRNKSWRFILQTTLVLTLSSLSNIMLKRFIDRSRPSLEHLVEVSSLSYPSGHAMSAMAFYGFLIFLCLRYSVDRWVRVVLVFLLCMIIASVGFSRIYLGVHYPSDVLAGYIGGLIWVVFCAIVFSVIELRRKNRKR